MYRFGNFCFLNFKKAPKCRVIAERPVILGVFLMLGISGQCAWAKNSFTKNIPQIEPNFSYIQPIHICRTVFLHIFSKFSSNMTFSVDPN